MTPTAFGESLRGGLCVFRHRPILSSSVTAGALLGASFSAMQSTDTDTKRIRVSEPVRNALWERKQGPTDSYDRVLRRELGLES